MATTAACVLGCRPPSMVEATTISASAPAVPSSLDCAAHDDAPSRSAPASAIRMLDPGAPPRRVLRYAYEPGRAHRVELALTSRSERETGLTKSTHVDPPVRYVIGLASAGCGAHGSFAVDVIVLEAHLDAPPSADVDAGSLVAGLWPIDPVGRPALMPLQGKRARFLVHPWAGASIEGGLPAGAEPLRVAEIENELLRAVPALPREAVGVGARWGRVIAADDNETTTERESIVTLTAFAADGSLILDERSRGEPSDEAAPDAGGPGHGIETRSRYVVDLRGPALDADTLWTDVVASGGVTLTHAEGVRIAPQP